MAPTALVPRVLTIPKSFVDAVIDIALNSTVFLTFLMGIYTVVYFGSVYIYLTRRSGDRQRLPIICAITILYMLCIAWFATQWFILRRQFVFNVATEKTIFTAIYNFPNWIQIVLNVTTFLMYIIADGLLVWRCYRVWDCSFRMTAAPMFFFVGEIAFYMATLGYQQLPDPLTPKQVVIGDAILSSAYFASFASSIIATLLIAYRIYSVSKKETRYAQRFRNVLEMVVQSAAFYSMALFVTAVIETLPPETALEVSAVASQSWTITLLVPITGIAPTLMMARVAMAADDTRPPPEDTSLHLSQLRFDNGTKSGHNGTLHIGLRNEEEKDNNSSSSSA
ncbi:hypothetical protein CPC08DRAFT_713033 [Agrocybe pediades]|nr:hypothetical protein CPC08DRAFT_713033 [Agrocybe pediades]